MRILLVDDERFTRNELGRILAELDPRDNLFEASSGEEALQAMKQEDFHLLVIDMDLGDMMGTSVAWAVQSMQPDVPIIFSTAYYDQAVKALELGAVDYVLKPFDPLRVSLAVRRAKTARPPASAVQADKLPLQDNCTIELVDIHEVSYIETYNRRCLIHTAECVYEDPAGISIFEKCLENKGFLRCHESFLINLDYLNAIFPWVGGGYALSLRGMEDKSLPIARTQLRTLKNLLRG